MMTRRNFTGALLVAPLLRTGKLQGTAVASPWDYRRVDGGLLRDLAAASQSHTNP